MRGRDLENCRVLERGDAMDGARAVAERRPAADHLLGQNPLADLAELELRLPRLDEPRLVLLAVELEAERRPRLHEQHLAAVLLGERPDQLVPPGLLDAAHVEAPAVERIDVGGT